MELPPAVDQVEPPRSRDLEQLAAELAAEDAELGPDPVRDQALEEVAATGTPDQGPEPVAQLCPRRAQLTFAPAR